jgi:tripartite-type tricarboxylate transporter receptor subunit TctC
MKMMKKHGMALALLLAVAGTGQAQPAQDAGSYPNRPVTLIVPTAAAGGTDTIARVFAEGLTRLLRQPFVVDNRPGANGLVGVEQAARGAPHGVHGREPQPLPQGSV